MSTTRTSCPSGSFELLSPQRRGLIPEPQLSALLVAQHSATDADEAYQLAVADALKAGGSVREVGQVTGLSTSTVQKWGHAHGWPTSGQRKTWADEQAPRDEWAARMAAAKALDDL
jgi:hypothetical protein